MATVPLSGTNIRLMSGVPFSNDYKNTRWFDTKTAQTNYFTAKPTTYVKADHTFQRIEGRHYIKANASIDSLWGTNYLMFQNTDYNSKWFYAFVTKLEYVNPSTTLVYFEIDVFQTWKFEMNFKPSFVIREHCPLWNTDGTPVVNTIDEGLNYGTEYETVSVENYKPSGDLLYLVIVTKETMHTTSTLTSKMILPTLNGMPQPLSYYIHPFRTTDGEVPLLNIGGTQPLTSILAFLKGIFTHTDAVNNVVSLYVTDYIGKYATYDGTTLTLDSASFEPATVKDSSNVDLKTIYAKSLLDYESITHDMGNKYTGFNSVDESKLLMYPYTVTYLDDFKGNRMLLKNEYIKNTNLVLRVKGSLGTSNKVAYSVDDYLSDSDLTFDEKFKMSLEHSLINNNPNDISILNDFLSAYLQGNRNQIENQKSAIMFNGTVGALTGGMVGMAQSTYSANVGGARRMLANPFGVGAAGLQATTGVGHAIIEMQGLQAKQKDIDNTPAQMVKMGGNSAFDFGNDYNGVYVIKKQITQEYRETLTHFFNMFGYKVNRVKVPNFHTRQNWNYVQTSNCTVLGNMNNEDLGELRKVFDSGITLWHTDDVGNYALENGVI